MTGGRPSSRSSSTSTAAAWPTSSGCRSTSRCRSTSTTGSAAATCPTQLLQEAWCGEPCLTASDAALVRRVLHHRLRHPLRHRPDRRGGAVDAQPPRVALWMRRYVVISDGALAIYIAYPMAPPWMASQRRVHRRLPAPDHRPRWGDIGLDRLRPSCRASATRSPRCRPCTPASRSWWRPTPSCDCAPGGAGCWCSTHWRCVALVYYAEHYVIDILAGGLLAVLVMVACTLLGAAAGAAAGRRRLHRLVSATAPRAAVQMRARRGAVRAQHAGPAGPRRRGDRCREVLALATPPPPSTAAVSWHYPSTPCGVRGYLGDIDKW